MAKTPRILYRDQNPGSSEDREERAAASKYFPLTKSRLYVKPNDLVIGRYSVLPYFRELEQDVLALGGQLINSFQQHSYVADLRFWYQDLIELTPETWFNPSDVPTTGPERAGYVLKGHTNSRKSLWRTHMFAPDRRSIGSVLVRLLEDVFISQQQIYVREYVPLKTYMVGLNGQPITDEYRFFICRGQVVSGAYYWSSHVEDLHEAGIYPDVNSVPKDLLERVISSVGDRCTFYVVDVAQTAEGKWIVIELNDGCMSGLSENSPEQLYQNLAQLLGAETETETETETKPESNEAPLPARHLKSMVSAGKKVRFTHYRQGNLYYQTECGFSFPVPVEDTGEATFLMEDRAMLFMRYIRKALGATSDNS